MKEKVQHLQLHYIIMPKHLKIKTLTLLILSSFLHSYSQKKITLKDIWYNYSFAPNYYNDAVFLNDNASIVRLQNNRIVSYNAITGDSTGIFFDASKHKECKGKTINDFVLSENDSNILLSFDSKKVYRYSSLASYYIYSFKTKKLEPITKENADIDIPAFSTKSNAIAFVKGNNLYISENGNTVQITNDGKKDSISNGRTDWVYEEEFEVIKAYEWNADGTQLAWIKFDESKVPSYTLTQYDSVYPTTFTYKYPKAGYPNSKVSVHIYNTLTKVISTVTIPDLYEYIPMIKWSIDGRNLAIQTFNRLQNHTIIYSYDCLAKKVTSIFNEKCNTYFSFPMGFTWLRHGKHFALITEKDGYNQLCTYTMDGKIERNITNWKYDVTKVLAYDSLLDYVFFEAAEPDEMQRRIYRVRPDGSFLGYISPENGTNSDAIFSKDYFHCIYTNTNAKQEITTYSFDELKGMKNILQSNVAENEERQNKYDFAPKTFFKIPIDTLKLDAWIIKPKAFEEGKKYPVLVTVYAGPGHQEVTNEYDYTYYWHQYLAMNGYIVVSIDPRGTDARGLAFRNACYKQLGIPETNDLIESVKYLRNQPYIDSTRIGMQGWSFGGYQTLMCMTHSNLFKCGVAIAPVTDWRFYDNIYTERYMQTPELNPDGYKNTSVLESAAKLHGSLLLVHGDNDDNVHIQNTYALCNILNNYNIKYQFIPYPNKHHSLSGRPTRLNLFENVTKFIFDNL